MFRQILWTGIVIVVCGLVFWLVSLFERLPEWARWILYLPVLALAVIAGNMFSYTFVSASEGSWLWWRMLCDLGGVTASMWFMIYIAGALAPRGKRVAATLTFASLLIFTGVMWMRFWPSMQARLWRDEDYLNAEKGVLWLTAGPVIWWSVFQSFRRHAQGPERDASLAQAR
jgi:hypothetical protein